ncbi:hypothetical protein [Micromonospora sp. WMMD714]|uniref:hypothetical protein n=1 Tax=Micromonospora sp. WMMD714 TaxID=3016097 RepID=UPI00249C1C6D|nr:hypothetical protein [Micromonospora sp. WMMD714]WFE62616.1 hypothetical protein O7625_04625 [Micromonospora sp. WMMD714]
MRALGPAFAAVAVVVGLLTGCSAADPSSPAPTPAATTGSPVPTAGEPSGTAPTAGGPTDGTAAMRITLTRSGGFAGNRDTVTVEPDGRWTTTDRAGATRTGRLEPTQLDRLRALAGPAARERDSPPDAACADTFAYRLTIGTHSVDWTDCPSGPPPPAAAHDLATLLLQTTTTG